MPSKCTQQGARGAAAAPTSEGIRTKKAGVTPAFLVSIRSALSISGGCRSTPTKPVVHADLGGVFVVAEAPASDIGGSRGQGGVAEIGILVLRRGRPGAGKYVVEAAAEVAAVLAAAVGS